MQRVKLCAIILIILIILSMGSLWMINLNCKQLKNEVLQLQELCEKKETALALEKTDELNRSWKKNYKQLSCLVKNDKLSSINISIAQIRPLIESGNDELSALFSNIIYQIDLLRETEIPYFYNIF